MTNRKRHLAALLSVIVLLMTFSTIVSAEAADFVDLPPEGHWTHDAIVWAYEEGIASGVDPTHFAPKEQIDRAQAVMMVWRTKNSMRPYNTEEMPFRDVNPSAYYYQALQLAWEEGWVSGVAPDSFAPHALCTRAQAVALLGKAFHIIPRATADDEETPPIKDAEDFVDVNRNSYYYDSLWMFAAAGVVSGTDETHFSPNEPCTRAQFAVMLYRIIETQIFG